MPVLSPADFLRALPGAGALMGVDTGKKRVGLAVSDPDRRVAAPLDTIARSKFAADAARLFELYHSRACVGLVVGLPLNMDGSESASAQAARAFARNLLAVQDAPVLMWDERLTSAAVNRALIEADASRRERASLVDKAAAAYLLQTALERLDKMESGGG
ncbi:MAG TPA: Holliday junction resolvase RuvX [Caulobacterales bacterium]|nr:Holliday junction resolvase RuvX [Caulobacterales bacterium]